MIHAIAIITFITFHSFLSGMDAITHDSFSNLSDNFPTTYDIPCFNNSLSSQSTENSTKSSRNQKKNRTRREYAKAFPGLKKAYEDLSRGFALLNQSNTTLDAENKKLHLRLREEESYRFLIQERCSRLQKVAEEKTRKKEEVDQENRSLKAGMTHLNPDHKEQAEIIALQQETISNLKRCLELADAGKERSYQQYLTIKKVSAQEKEDREKEKNQLLEMLVQEKNNNTLLSKKIEEQEPTIVAQSKSWQLLSNQYQNLRSLHAKGVTLNNSLKRTVEQNENFINLLHKGCTIGAALYTFFGKKIGSMSDESLNTYWGAVKHLLTYKSPYDYPIDLYYNQTRHMEALALIIMGLKAASKDALKVGWGIWAARKCHQYFQAFPTERIQMTEDVKKKIKKFSLQTILNRKSLLYVIPTILPFALKTPKLVPPTPGFDTYMIP